MDGQEQQQRKVIFGKYEVGRLLGKGTFAKVYYGKNIITNDTVAIKIINKSLVTKQGLTDQITREISVMKLLKHPNIVDLKEVLATKTKIYFILEHIKGGELFAKVAKGRMSENEAKGYFRQLISAVEFCHSRGVSHRDLKPENLLLDENGVLKVSDFGLSALPQQRGFDGLLHTRCGTPAYVAPEVLKKKGYAGAEADVWSCGVILYVLLAGFLPFQDENVMCMYRKIFKAEYEIPPWFSNEAKRVIGKLLVVDPSRRITISGIMRMPWFRNGFESNVKNQKVLLEDSVESVWGRIQKTKMPSPPVLNAFELISSLSSGFNLSGLFEDNTKEEIRSVFTSRSSASKVAEDILSLAGRSGLEVEKDKEEFKLRIEGSFQGRKGKLAVIAEVFEVAPDVTLVEFSKSKGDDTLEYNKFLKEAVRPALKDIVWAWQGDHIDK